MISKSVLNKACFATKAILIIAGAMAVLAAAFFGLAIVFEALLPGWSFPIVILIACFGYIFYLAYTQAPQSTCVKEDSE